jgi:hypothetical protein
MTRVQHSLYQTTQGRAWENSLQTKYTNLSIWEKDIQQMGRDSVAKTLVALAEKFFVDFIYLK